MRRNHRGALAAVAVALAVIGSGAGVIATSGPASAGVSAPGYASIAQAALKKAAAPYGYRVSCSSTENYATAAVTVTCKMTG